MLSSMYPNSGEFCFDDPVTLDLIKNVVSGEIGAVSIESRLGFTILVSCYEKDEVKFII